VTLRDAAGHSAFCACYLLGLPWTLLAEDGKQDDPSPGCDVVGDSNRRTLAYIETQLAELASELARSRFPEQRPAFHQSLQVARGLTELPAIEAHDPLFHLGLELQLTAHSLGIPQMVCLR
jgi:hypothetical protein